MEYVWQVGHVLDIYQTFKCAHRKGCREAGGASNIIGNHPSDFEIAAWGIGMGAAHYFIAREASEINPWAGRVFEGITIAVKADTVIANWKIGLHP